MHAEFAVAIMLMTTATSTCILSGLHFHHGPFAFVGGGRPGYAFGPFFCTKRPWWKRNPDEMHVEVVVVTNMMKLDQEESHLGTAVSWESAKSSLHQPQYQMQHLCTNNFQKQCSALALSYRPFYFCLPAGR